MWHLAFQVGRRIPPTLSTANAPILDNFDPTPNYRHASMYDTLCWAMREAKSGRFSAQHALDECKGLWDKSFGIRDD
jgi:hypothetical protein